MRTLRTFLHRLSGLFRTGQLDRKSDRGLSSHLDLHDSDNLRAGTTEQEARHDALIKLGGIEQSKEVVCLRALPFFDNPVQDVRFGLRMLGKNPGFTTVAILTLALGIGANTAIFSVVNAVLLRSIPFPHPSELIDISARNTSFDLPYLNMSLPDINDIRSSARSLAGVAAFREVSKELSGNGKPESLKGAEVSEDFFTILGLRPIDGRSFTREDIKPGVHVAVLSYSLWQDSFGANPTAVGRTITIDGQPHTIVGVMPDQLALGFATDAQIWTPLLPSDEERGSRAASTASAIARLKTGVTLTQAQNELNAISARLVSDYPDAHKGWSIQATPLKEYLFGEARTPLAVLFCAVGFVLLIACANVSNLFLSRGWARRREFAIRFAMGATRVVILRQLAVECVLVALAGGTCAFVLAMGTLNGLRSILPPDIPRLQGIRIDGQVAWFTLGTSLVAALLAGLAPALLSSQQDVSLSLKENAGGSAPNLSRAPHNFLQRSLITGEVAIAAILLIGATLALRSLDRLLHQNLGFQPDHLVTFEIEFPKFRFASEGQAIAFVEQVLDRSRAVPGVIATSAGLVFPMSDEIAETTFETEATVADPNLGEQPALGNRVAPDFFRTLGIPMLAGRDFTRADTKGSRPVFIVNEALARKYFGSMDVIGKRLSTRRESGHPTWGEIVGVVGNVREATANGETKPQIYAPFFQIRNATAVYVVVRSNSDPLAVVPAVEERIWAVDKNQPIISIKTVKAQIAEVNGSRVSQSILLAVFAVLGCALALVGVYGVMSYLVSLQTRDIGIRIALGADRRQILGSVISQGMQLTLAGVLIGLVCGLVLTRFMQSLLFLISPTDPVTFASIAILLTIVALVACYIPARRATKVDPMISLRYE